MLAPKGAARTRQGFGVVGSCGAGSSALFVHLPVGQELREEARLSFLEGDSQGDIFERSGVPGTAGDYSMTLTAILMAMDGGASPREVRELSRAMHALGEALRARLHGEDGVPAGEGAKDTGRPRPERCASRWFPPGR